MILAVDRAWFWWAVLGLALVGQYFFYGAKTPGRQWLVVTCEVLPFIALFFIVRLRNRARLDPKHFFLKLALLVVILLLLNPFGPFGSDVLPFLPIPGIVGRFLLAAKGWLLPIVILGFFVAFGIFKHTQSSRSRR